MAELRKNLGFWTIFAITITAMIGTGMFFGTAIAAEKTGNASIIAWVILGIITVYVGSCFGELTSMFPKAGGIYEFTKQAYGKGLLSFLIGWTSWIVINMMNSLLIVAALDYILPASTSIWLKVFFSLAIIIILNYFTYLGTDTISAILGVFAVIILIVLVTIISFGTTHINIANYSPLFSMPFMSLFIALFFIVETFFGWENASFMAEETKDAERVIPRAVLISSIFVAVLGIFLAIVFLGVIPWQILAQSTAPLADLSLKIFNPDIAIAVQIGITLALIGSAAGGIIGSPRLLMGLARDKFFIEQLADIHPKYQTPYKAIIFQTIVSILLIFIGFASYRYLLSLLVPLALMMYISVLLSVTILRYKKPQHPRPYRTWFGKSGPILVSIIYTTVLVAWLIYVPNAVSMFKLGLSFILFGIPIFLLLISYYDPDAIKRVNDSFARMGLLLEGINFPKSFRKELLAYFTDLEDKKVLDYGAGIGTLTLHLADLVGPNGRVYATDISAKNIDILHKRLEGKKLKNVEIILDEHQFSRIHPDIKSVDVVFSVGVLSYIQDIKKILKDIHRILPKHGKICMVEYVDYFWILPNRKWLSEEKIVSEIFREAGFSVHVIKKKGILWSYLIIYGIKTEDDVPYV
jgi:amino acid transporter/phospholipid N-methyltransferase